MSPAQIVTLSGLGFFLISGALINIAAGWYDIKDSGRRRRLANQPRRRVLRRRPPIVVIIQAESSGLKDCLSSLAAGKYRNYSVIVSTSTAARKTVRRAADGFRQAHPTKSVHVTIRDPKSALKGRTGELIVYLNRPQILPDNSLADAVDRFALEPLTELAVAEAAIQPEESVGNLIRRYRLAASGQFHKAGEALGLAGWTAAGAPLVIYRRQAYLSQNQNRRRLVKTGSYVFLMSGLILAGYGIYLAAAAITADLLAIIWTAAAVFLILAVWGDDNFSSLQSFRLSLLAPPATLILYIEFALRLLSAPIRLLPTSLKSKIS